MEKKVSIPTIGFSYNYLNCISLPPVTVEDSTPLLDMNELEFDPTEVPPDKLIWLLVLGCDGDIEFHELWIEKLNGDTEV